MHELQVEVETPLVEIRRLRSAQNTPIVIETTHHPYARFPSLLHMDLNDRSIYAILEQEYNVRPAQSRDRFVAEAASKEDAALLEIEPGAPVMRYKRTRGPERADHGVHHFHLPRRPVPVRHRVQRVRLSEEIQSCEPRSHIEHSFNYEKPISSVNSLTLW